MQLRPDYGTYIPGLVTLEGSFRVNGTSDPDDVRTGNTGLFTVARTSAGLFTVTFCTQVQGGIQLPQKLISFNVSISQGVAPGAEASFAHLVVDSYSQVTRSFQIQITDGDTPAANDPVDNDVVGFILRGSIVGIGTD